MSETRANALLARYVLYAWYRVGQKACEARGHWFRRSGTYEAAHTLHVGCTAHYSITRDYIQRCDTSRRRPDILPFRAWQSCECDDLEVEVMLIDIFFLGYVYGAVYVQYVGWHHATI